MNQLNTSIEQILQTYSYEITKMLKSMSNEFRLKILGLLMDSRKTFQEIQNYIGLSKTATAHHLEILTNEGFIIHMSRGNYELSYDGQKLLEIVIQAFLHTQKVREDEILRKSEYILRTHQKRSESMSEIDVRIVELEPMQVASVRVISPSPEHDAWLKLKQWAKPKGLLNDLKNHPVFGFNNPNPSKDSTEYGYEFWIKIDPETDYGVATDIQFKKFNGGKFAVATSKLKEDIDTDGVLKTWKKLTSWVENSDYNANYEIQCLEHALQPDAHEDELILDLYLPINEK